jgi:predicted TIM-barrel fold metal-dependent hydrolase
MTELKRQYENDGRVYFKTHHVSDETDLTPQAVSAAFRHLQDEGALSLWRESCSPMTWCLEEDHVQSAG